MASPLCNPLYAITISPPATYHNAIWLLNDYEAKIRKILRRCSEHWVLYPEFDDKGRLHFHGVIRMDDFVKWKKSSAGLLQHQLGYIKIEKIATFKRHLGWLRYCKKEWHITMAGLKINSPLMPQAPTKAKNKPNKVKTINDYFNI